MKFNDTTNGGGIIQTIEELCDLGSTYISGNATTLKEFTNRINRINHRVLHLIHSFSRSWKYDDSNNTDLPISITDLTSAKRQYLLPTDALSIERVEILDDNGTDWVVLTPLMKEQISMGLDDFMEIDSRPMYYSLSGDVLELYPASNYTETGGLKVYYTRDSVDFATNDTTKTPGFASPYHEIIPIKASIEWLKVKQPTSPTLQLLLQDDAKLEQSLKEFYAKRFGSIKPRITRRKECFK